jgi:L-asparagine transporter-like permease
MNGEMQATIFIVYFVLWAIIGLTFYFLIKKSRDAQKKKRLSLYSGILIFLLMLGVIIIIGFPAKIIPIFIVVAIGMLYMANKYTFYCQSCGQRVQQPFTKIEFCPKCGTKIVN